jgi:hypothetical protein
VKRIATILLLAGVALVLGAADNPHDTPATIPTPRPSQVRFAWVDAYIDPQGQPLAAYQFELKAQGADVTLVGVEGSEHPAYVEPPYYDPKANLQNRIVIAAFNTGENLPTTKTRVARVMVRVSGAGEPRYSAKLEVAASSDAMPISANISVSEGAAP